MSLEQVFLNKEVSQREQLDLFNTINAVSRANEGVAVLEESNNFEAKYYGIENDKGEVNSYISYSYYDGVERNNGIRFKEGENFTSISATSYFGGKPNYTAFSINEHSGMISRINGQEASDLYADTAEMLNSFENHILQASQDPVQE